MLREKYPKAFNDLRRPLKNDIHLDMGLTYPDPAMRAWVTHPEYLKNMSRGGMRIDLALVTQPVAERITWAIVDRNARKGKLPSDHAPLIIDLRD